MTNREIEELCLDIATVLAPYANSGKIAGYRMILAVKVAPGQVIPMVTGSCMSDEVEELLKNPKFIENAESAAKTMIRRDS
jgi:hypothetical protein